MGGFENLSFPGYMHYCLATILLDMSVDLREHRAALIRASRDTPLLKILLERRKGLLVHMRPKG
jgi:hypothetical protein